MAYIPPLPADLVDEYLTFDCSTLSKLEKKMNAASADGYKLLKGIKQYEKPENDKYHARTRFWAVMTKRVDPTLLAGAVKNDGEVVEELSQTTEPTDGELFQERMRQ